MFLRARRPSTFDGGGDGMPHWYRTMLFFIVGGEGSRTRLSLVLEAISNVSPKVQENVVMFMHTCMHMQM